MGVSSIGAVVIVVVDVVVSTVVVVTSGGKSLIHSDCDIFELTTFRYSKATVLFLFRFVRISI